MSNTADSVLAIARGEIGYDRFTDPKAGTKYGRWYAEQTGSSYYGENGVPYCAMFVSWVFAQAGAKCVGIPSAYCPYIVRDGKNAGKAVSKTQAKAGDVVLFDWGGDGVSDHVGIVEANHGSYLQTIEGNTNNGKVARRTRAFSTVCLVIRPDYGVASNGSSLDLGDLGYWGEKFTSEMQRQLGTTVDGVVSGQSYYNRKYLCNAGSGWDFQRGPDNGSQMIKALQLFLINKGYSVGSDGADGWLGYNSVKGLQGYLKGVGLYSDSIDGCMGYNTCTAVGNALIKGLFHA